MSIKPHAVAISCQALLLQSFRKTVAFPSNVHRLQANDELAKVRFTV